MTAQKLVIYAQARCKTADCPACQQPSAHYHSSYIRTVKDLPVGTELVELHLKTRRFRCSCTSCPQDIFAEQHSGIVGRYGRFTKRLTTHLTQIGVALGGQAGADLARKLKMPASGATLLRLVRQIDLPPAEPPRIIGIDDWAIRKGRTYGTIVVDLERQRPIDLLPSREGDTVKEWLKPTQLLR